MMNDCTVCLATRVRRTSCVWRSGVREQMRKVDREGAGREVGWIDGWGMVGWLVGWMFGEMGSGWSGGGRISKNMSVNEARRGEVR